MVVRSKILQPLSEQLVLEELKKYGITTLEELAQNIAAQSAAKAQLDTAKAQFDAARGIPTTEQSDYVWSGTNYSLYHPEPAGPACW